MNETSSSVVSGAYRKLDPVVLASGSALTKHVTSEESEVTGLCFSWSIWHLNKRNAGLRDSMRFSNVLAAVLLVAMSSATASAEEIPVRHIQRPMHRFMVARSPAGDVIARGEFSQMVEGDDVTMRLTYRFTDGSLDEETTTYRQQGTFRLVRNHHVQQGPFFEKPVDFTVDGAADTATTRTTGKAGKIHVESEHMTLPHDLANGFVGTLLLNVPADTKPFRVAMLAPVGGGRLIQLLVSPEGKQGISMSGKALTATVFRIHPELGGIVGVIARLIGLQPKDVMVWVLEGEDPAVVRIVGQLGGYGPVVSSDLEGVSFGR